MSSNQVSSAAQDKSSPVTEKSGSEQDQANVPRSSVGVVNDAGEIVDKDGKAIGKIAESKDAKSLAGNTVTAAGEVLNSTGDIVGKAAGGEYTTENADDAKSSGGGFFSGAANTVGSLGKPVTGLVSGLSGKGDDNAQSDAPTPAEEKSEADQQTEDGSQIPDDAATNVPETEAGDVQDAATEAGSQAQDEGQDIQDNQDLDSQAPVNLEDRDEQEGVDDQVSKAGDEVSKAGDEADQANPDVDPSQAGDVAGDEASKAGDEVSKAGDEAEEAKPDVDPSQAGDVTGDEVSKAGDEAEQANPDVDASQAGDAAAEAGEAAEDEAADAEQAKPDVDASQAGDAAAEAGEAAEDQATDAEQKVDEESEQTKPVDFTVLKGTKVNKAGKLVSDNGDIIGRLIEGDAKHLQGKKCDEEGNIWDDSGKKIGKAEPIPESELEKKDYAPFENFPDAVVEGDGKVTSDGKQIGVVVEGDPKRLKGSKVDEDGDILDRRGNVIGKAEAWDEPEPIEEEEVQVDNSQLAGKRVNKAGYVVDGSGVIWGKVVEGNVSSIVGRMCDKEGNIRSESGDVVGRAELVPEGEREGSKEGPFAELSGLTVTKDGKVVTAGGDIVGRLTSGDGKKLFGRSVDEDGDVLDRNGNSIGKAERWEEPEEEAKPKGPMEGRKVNREGNVLNDEGSIIGKLVNGDLLTCAGKEVDGDGDVINSKGNTVGHVALLEDIPPEPEESEEEKKTREQAEADRKLAGQLGSCIEQSLEKIRPILRMITEKIDKAERTPKEELDEEELVKQVKPLIEEGGKILTETNGVIRGLDPDGRIQKNAKHKSATKDASPEEHHLADQLKELTGDVTKTIDNAKSKIEDMPHAKKELNPLWGLLSDPLIQILAAVGLLLNGVLGLVGKLLGMLGLGGIVDNILGGLGINKLLGSLGLGSAYDALTGKNKNKDKKK